MVNIAITGSFASGKSFVLNCAKKLGYKVFSCDDFVKEIYKDVSFQNKIVDEFKELKIFDKKELSKIIYDDSKVRKRLESIIHPIVREGIKKFEELHKDKELLFTEVPLLFESKFDKYFSYSICTFCNEETRLLRAKKRGVIDLNLYEKIKIVQMDQEEKKKKANFIIDTQLDQKEIEKILNNIIKQVK